MIAQGQATSKHTHARAYVNRELAYAGLISKESAKLYNRLMDDRSDADYNVEIFDQAEAEKMLEGVRLFNEEIRGILGMD